MIYRWLEYAFEIKQDCQQTNKVQSTLSIFIIISY